MFSVYFFFICFSGPFEMTLFFMFSITSFSFVFQFHLKLLFFQQMSDFKKPGIPRYAKEFITSDQGFMYTRDPGDRIKIHIHQGAEYKRFMFARDSRVQNKVVDKPAKDVQ